MKTAYRAIRPLAMNGKRLCEKGVLCEIVKPFHPKHQHREVVRIGGREIELSGSLSAKAFGLHPETVQI